MAPKQEPIQITCGVVALEEAVEPQLSSVAAAVHLAVGDELARNPRYAEKNAEPRRGETL